MADSKSVATECAVAAGLFVGCTLPSAFLLVNTRKASPLRFLWAVGLTYLAHCYCSVASKITTSFVLNGMIVGQGMIGIFQCFNLVLITSLDENDLVRAAVYEHRAGFLRRIGSTFGLLANYRGISTPWQAKTVPEFPAFYINHGSRTRPALGWYIARQVLIISWQYLLLDLIYTSSLDASPEENARLFGPGLEFKYWDLTPEQWTGRLLVGAIAWFIPARTVLDISARCFLLPFVASGILHPDACPPTFGRIGSAYTLRKFWRYVTVISTIRPQAVTNFTCSTFWHQYLRWPLTSLSNFLARDVLRLKRPSVLERYTNIYFVFLGSGVFHLIYDTYLGSVPGESKAVMFFSSFAFGIMIEDGVQEAWRRLNGESGTRKETPKNGVPVWHKVVGFIWVVVWLLLTAPWYLYPSARLPTDIKWLVPFSIVELIGMPTSGIVLAAGGLCLMFVVGGEI